MKKIVASLALIFCCNAYADELADANKLLENRSYPQALNLYNKLALSGNAEAQFHLGEMYLYGEGVLVDTAKAKEWFQQASAAGDKKSGAALQLIAQRAARKADIDFYVSGYTGAEVALSKFNCVEPEIPEISKTKRQIQEVADRTDAWTTCYNRFVNNLNTALPPGKTIPQDIESLMNEQEFSQAKALMDKTYAGISAQAQQKAQQIAAQRVAWQSKTETYLQAENSKVESDKEIFEYNKLHPRQSIADSPQVKSPVIRK